MSAPPAEDSRPIYTGGVQGDAAPPPYVPPAIFFRNEFAITHFLYFLSLWSLISIQHSTHSIEIHMCCTFTYIVQVSCVMFKSVAGMRVRVETKG